jgi:hypothetical protein
MVFAARTPTPQAAATVAERLRIQRRRASAVRCNARLSAGSSTFKPILSTKLIRSAICGFLYVLAFQVVATELPGHLIH